MEEISTGEKYDVLALQIYIDIAARCGLIEKAKNLVTSLLEKTEKQYQKLRLLRMLFNIEMYIDPKSDKLIDIWFRYGKLCNKNDEVEEGIYLLFFLAATFDPEKVVKEEDVKEFQTRLLKYKVNFPESKVLRSFRIDEAAPESFLDQLSKMTGFTEEKKKWYQRNEKLLRTSQFPVPFLIRPILLLNVSNFLHLWELAKIAGLDYPQYLLTISAGQYQIRKVEKFRRRLPIIDEIALMVLFELGILEYIFKIFPRVLIVKDTITNFLSVAQQFCIMPYQNKAKDIIAILSKNVDQIKMPSSRELKEEDNLFEQVKHLKSVYDQSIHLFYTDDAILRVYICGDDHFKDSITTIDIIELLKRYNVISIKEAAEKYARLCSFHVVGTPINFKDMLLVLEDDIPKGETIDIILETLRNHSNFNYFIGEVWRYKGDYLKALIEIGQFLSYMICGEDGIFVEQNIIIAIWYYWYQKVQFIIKSEKDKLHFLARSFLSTCIQINRRIGSKKGSVLIWQQAWSIYKNIIEFAYGNDMSKVIENKSKSLLAQMICEYEIDTNKKIFNDIASGLTSDTVDSICFKSDYVDCTIAIQRKKEAR